MQNPAAVLADELRVGERQVRAQADCRQAFLGVVDAQAAEHAPKVADSGSAVSYSGVDIDDIEGAGPGGAVRFARAPRPLLAIDL